MILPLLLLLFSCGSFAATETLLHSCPPPDTEFETNLVAEVWDNFDRIMGIRLEFNASPSNNVQAAFGIDEDYDGVLSIEESEFTVGWDCGVKHDDLSKINKHDRTKVDLLYSLSKHSDGIDIYYVDQIAPNHVTGFSRHNGNKIVIGPNATLSTLSHELGHSFGMVDIYERRVRKRASTVSLLEVHGTACADMFSPCDWNGGTGTRYYELDLKSVLIRAFLMCGNRIEARMDIPLESVDGLIRDDSAPSGGRPSWAAIGFRGHQMHGITH